FERGRRRQVKLGAVVTACGLLRTDGFDVLVRADGGTGLPDLPEADRVAANGDRRRLLLVDFRDEHHPVPRRLSPHRRDAHLRAGWNLLGKPAPGPMDRFAAERPGVR